MIPSKPDLTHLKPPSGRTFSLWRSAGVALSAGVAAVCLSSLPARAVSLLGDPSTWTNANACDAVLLIESSCVDDIWGGDYDIAGTDAPGTYTITSPTATIDTFISFNYTFDPEPGLAIAGYILNGGIFTPLDASLSSSTGPLLLNSGSSFSFELTNNGEQPLLGLSSFTATPVPVPAPTDVPGPLPLLGVVIAFGWIRRLRARCRGVQLNR